ncbi:helix-turn-helix domain-containing protein [Qipengyuania flava]|uniref:helix-turn-helix domain-containing protein n=1 Tax=Qipengyuania flava TaxID=192812 RepID=UPI001C62AE0D|nr:helix-turn-helix domain-containing protein [Qipengyuania flava]QYJ07817.1 helix-turn-helix domain-containing protein [Qipengyuania flava]
MARLGADDRRDGLHLALLAETDGLCVEKDERASLGERGDRLVFIAKGSMKLVAHASDARDQIVAFQFAGDLVCVPARSAHAYSLVALEPCRIEAIGYEALIGICQGNAAVMGNLLSAARLSLARCREKSIGLGRKSAPERLASYLLSIAERIGRHTEDGVALDLPMSRRDIAESLGLTIETVSRQFTLLREEGLVETTGRSGVTLRDPAALAARAGFLEVGR